jgi:hypothetical protein
MGAVNEAVRDKETGAILCNPSGTPQLTLLEMLGINNKTAGK